MSARAPFACLLVAGCLGAVPAAAQQPVWGGADAQRRGAVEIGGGVSWSGGFDVESLPANLTANAGNQAPAVTLFDTDTSVGSIAGVQARAGVFLGAALALEARVTFSRPVVAIRISGDFEGASDLTIEQTMNRYAFDGSLVYFPRGAGDGAIAPFLLAGAGYLRELHEGNELVETGQTYHAGAGARIWLSPRRKLSLRVEGLVTVRDGGYGAGDGRRAVPSASASLGYVF